MRPCNDSFLKNSSLSFSGLVTQRPSDAAISCIVARQLCYEDPACAQLLEIVPKVCGLELGEWVILQKTLRNQQFQMNRYISHWFLKRLFWYILNLYGKLHLLVWIFLQKGHSKGPKKGLKNVDFANWEKYPHFLQMNRYIY